MRIGLIADTHGLFDPAGRQHFKKGVDHILHAGDIVDQSVIDQLQAIAPLTAVSGNVDGYEQRRFPSEIIIELAGCRIAIQHILYEGGKFSIERRAFLQENQPDLCIFGHTHQSTVKWFGKTLPYKPVPAGRRRFMLSRVLGILMTQNDSIAATHIVLDHKLQ